MTIYRMPPRPPRLPNPLLVIACVFAFCTVCWIGISLLVWTWLF